MDFDDDKIIDFSSYNQHSLDRIDEAQRDIKIAVRKIKLKKYSMIFTLGLLALLLIFLVILYFERRGYVDADVRYSRLKSEVMAEYESFSTGLIRYGKDGAIFIDRNGKEKWNEGYHMKNPIIDVNGSFAVIADLKGNIVNVFNESGGLCSMSIAMPISGIKISDNGVIMVVSDDEAASYIDFYNSNGVALANGKYPLDKNRFPICFDISNNGLRAAIAFIGYDKGRLHSEIAVLGFDRNDGTKPNNVIYSGDMEEKIPLKIDYISDNRLVILTDNSISMLNDGDIEITHGIKLNSSIRSVLYNDYMIVTVENNNELNKAVFYDFNGKELGNTNIALKYKSILLNREYLAVADEYELQLYNRKGELRFSKGMGNSIRDIKALGDKRSYLMVYDNRLEAITLH